MIGEQPINLKTRDSDIFHNSIKEEIQKAPNGYEFDVYVFVVALIAEPTV